MSCTTGDQDELVLIELKGKKMTAADLTCLTMSKPGTNKSGKGNNKMKSIT
jgi:hypothetical protein